MAEKALVAGKYRVLGELGRGGMGVVYRAEDVRLRRPVALKFLSEALSADPSARARFLREAQAAAALDSPHVCTVYEAGEHDGRAYIAMALIEGGSLKERIASGPLPLGETLAIARQVAEGLADAHSRKIVHRDIKPGNILLAGGRQARIADFGLARITGSGETTRTGGVVGTLAYMAPEQAQGLATDQRADVWAVGCVMYEMLAGRAPFSPSPGEVDLYALVHADPRPIAALRPEAPPRLGAVIERCLQKDPRRRYPDASSLLDDLKAIDLGAVASATGAPARPGVPSIAVLPFVDMSSDKSQEFFGEGIAEELIHALARIQGLRVVARTSAFAFKDRRLDVREIGRVLSVDAILEGSVRAAGNRLRITAQLINVADGFHLWSERFDRDAGDIFAIQDELSLAIVDHLKVTLHIGERDALQKRSTADHEAYNLYLKGLYFLARPRPDLVQKALGLFQEALARDPGFAKAHAAIGTAFAMLGNFNFAPPTEVYPKARAAIQKALALDETLGEAHAIAATVAFWYDWDWAAAEEAYNRNLALNPGDAFSHGDHAWFLLTRRRFDESLREIRRALDLDPLMPLFYGWSVGLHSAVGQLDEALREFERAKEIDPTFGLPYFHAGMTYFRKGMLDKAMEVLRQGVEIAPHPGWAEGMISVIRMQQGTPEEARRILDGMIAQRPAVNVSCMALAWASANLGDLDGAFQWVEHAIEERDTLVAFVHIYTPSVAPSMLTDPRFDALLDRLKLGDVAR
ncbi:MAG TPA: protein kinase [Thermoanaerobaculaceae bacterium]|nr:protein kinase [Thermoanaerobaculaceae bacterium]HPS77188.1 protein kinase [Thermoanaerobaculaceae bacterium]